MIPEKLTFFCELGGKELQALFADPAVIAHLQQLGARLALGLLDLGQQRATVVKRLNDAKIPVVAWQLLPKEQGYWYNMCNAPQAANRYAEFSAWTAAHALQWDAIGVDIEPDIGEFQQLMTHKMGLMRSLCDRGLARRSLCQGQTAYRALVTQMESDGYRVESYEFPFIVDELKAGSTLLRRIMGVTDVPANERVLMLYTSFFRPYGAAVLTNYAGNADSVAIGSTGGGVEIEGLSAQPPLNWDEFSRDLRLAGRCGGKLHIFSLEGCVQQGFLARLEGFNWEQPVPTPPWSTRVALLRKLCLTALWFSAHPLLSFAVAAAIFSLYML